MANKSVHERLQQVGSTSGQRRPPKQAKLVNYQVCGTDVLITSGPFQGRYVRELWMSGPNERDYVVKNLCKRNDAEVLTIINSLCGE